MNTRTITNAATALAVAAATFAGCAAEEVTTPAGPATTSPSGGPTNNTNTSAGMGPVGPVTTTVSTAAAVTNSNTTAASSTTGAGAVTNSGAAGVTNTTAPAVTTAAAGNTVGNATTGGGGCDLDPGDGTAPIIDDFEDNDHTILTNEGRVGYWYQYNDETTGATQTTAPIDGEPGVGGVLTSSGSGFVDFGAGVGVDLNNQAGEPCEYDASFYTGIQFNITTNVPVLFKVALPATAGDSGHYEFAIAAADSGLVKVPFTGAGGLAQPTWAEAATWDPSKILQLQWQTEADATFEITLDDVSFY